MEIVIHESEAQPIKRKIIDNFIRDYWDQVTPKKVMIKPQSLKEARTNNLNYIEILVTGILNPATVALDHQFKRRIVRRFRTDGIVVDNRIIDGPASTNILLTAQQVNIIPIRLGFRFRFPIEKMVELEPDRNWFYTLGKQDEAIFLLLYFVNQQVLPVGITPQALPGGTTSSGVKIPRGR